MQCYQQHHGWILFFRSLRRTTTAAIAYFRAPDDYDYRSQRNKSRIPRTHRTEIQREATRVLEDTGRWGRPPRGYYTYGLIRRFPSAQLLVHNTLYIICESFDRVREKLVVPKGRGVRSAVCGSKVYRGWRRRRRRWRSWETVHLENPPDTVRPRAPSTAVLAAVIYTRTHKLYEETECIFTHAFTWYIVFEYAVYYNSN